MDETGKISARIAELGLDELDEGEIEAMMKILKIRKESGKGLGELAEKLEARDDKATTAAAAAATTSTTAIPGPDTNQMQFSFTSPTTKAYGSSSAKMKGTSKLSKHAPAKAGGALPGSDSTAIGSPPVISFTSSGIDTTGSLSSLLKNNGPIFPVFGSTATGAPILAGGRGSDSFDENVNLSQSGSGDMNISPAANVNTSEPSSSSSSNAPSEQFKFNIGTGTTKERQNLSSSRDKKLPSSHYNRRSNKSSSSNRTSGTSSQQQQQAVPSVSEANPSANLFWGNTGPAAPDLPSIGTSQQQRGAAAAAARHGVFNGPSNSNAAQLPLEPLLAAPGSRPSSASSVNTNAAVAPPHPVGFSLPTAASNYNNSNNSAFDQQQPTGWEQTVAGARTANNNNNNNNTFGLSGVVFNAGIPTSSQPSSSGGGGSNRREGGSAARAREQHKGKGTRMSLPIVSPSHKVHNISSAGSPAAAAAIGLMDQSGNLSSRSDVAGSTTTSTAQHHQHQFERQNTAPVFNVHHASANDSFTSLDDDDDGSAATSGAIYNGSRAASDGAAGAGRSSSSAEKQRQQQQQQHKGRLSTADLVDEAFANAFSFRKERNSESGGINTYTKTNTNEADNKYGHISLGRNIMGGDGTEDDDEIDSDSEDSEAEDPDDISFLRHAHVDPSSQKERERESQKEREEKLRTKEQRDQLQPPWMGANHSRGSADGSYTGNDAGGAGAHWKEEDINDQPPPFLTEAEKLFWQPNNESATAGGTKSQQQQQQQPPSHGTTDFANAFSSAFSTLDLNAGPLFSVGTAPTKKTSPTKGTAGGKGANHSSFNSSGGSRDSGSSRPKSNNKHRHNSNSNSNRSSASNSNVNISQMTEGLGNLKVDNNSGTAASSSATAAATAAAAAEALVAAAAAAAAASDNAAPRKANSPPVGQNSTSTSTNAAASSNKIDFSAAVFGSTSTASSWGGSGGDGDQPPVWWSKAVAGVDDFGGSDDDDSSSSSSSIEEEEALDGLLDDDGDKVDTEDDIVDNSARFESDSDGFDDGGTEAAEVKAKKSKKKNKGPKGGSDDVEDEYAYENLLRRFDNLGTDSRVPPGAGAGAASSTSATNNATVSAASTGSMKFPFQPAAAAAAAATTAADSKVPQRDGLAKGKEMKGAKGAAASTATNATTANASTVGGTSSSSSSSERATVTAAALAEEAKRVLAAAAAAAAAAATSSTTGSEKDAAPPSNKAAATGKKSAASPIKNKTTTANSSATSGNDKGLSDAAKAAVKTARENIEKAAAAAQSSKTTKASLEPTPKPTADTTKSDHSLTGLAELYSKQGKELYGSKNYDRALDAFNKCINLAPKNWTERPTNLGNRAAAYMMLNRYPEAIADCIEALAPPAAPFFASAAEAAAAPQPHKDHRLVKLHIRHARALLRLGELKLTEAVLKGVAQMTAEDFQSVTNADGTLKSETGTATGARELAAIDELLRSYQGEASAGLQEIETIRKLSAKMRGYESQLNFVEVVREADNIMSYCPCMLAAQVAKSNALCELSKFDESKYYIESTVYGMHETILRPSAVAAAEQKTASGLPPSSSSNSSTTTDASSAAKATVFSTCARAHVVARLPPPPPQLLAWVESTTASGVAGTKPGSIVSVDIQAVVRAMLCMGSELAAVYLHALKNNAATRNCCADVMNKVAQILQTLSNNLSDDDTEETWRWASMEHKRVRELISLKNAADQQFKAGNFKSAVHNYSSALKIDASARKWNAILLSNRAAAHMCLNQFNDAVLDCHSAITKDPTYARAFLRRARAYRALKNKFNESVRDYRRYLCSDPPPPDLSDVKKELDDMTEARNNDIKAERARANQPPPSYYNKSNYYKYPDSNTRENSEKFKSYANNEGLYDDDEDDGLDDIPTPRNNNMYSGRPQSASQRPGSATYGQQQRPTSGRTGGGLHGGFKGRGGFTAGPGYARTALDSDSEDDDEDYEEDLRKWKAQQEARTAAREKQEQEQKTREEKLRQQRFAQQQREQQQQRDKQQREQERTRQYQQYQQQHSQQQQQQQKPSASSAGGDSFSLKETDHYKILGLAVTATEKDVKVAYRKLALKYHPDKNPGEAAAAAEEKFKLVGLAYSVLSDKAQRRQFDLTRPAPRTASSSRYTYNSKGYY